MKWDFLDRQKQLLGVKYSYLRAFDEFLLNTLPLQGVSEFSDKHKEACLNKDAQKAANQSVYSQATQSEKEKTQDRLGKLEILKVLEED